MKKSRISSIAAATILLFCLVLDGCSNKNDEGGTANSGSSAAPISIAVPVTTLLDAVPADAMLVTYMDTTQPAYGKWKADSYLALLASQFQAWALNPATFESSPQITGGVKALIVLSQGVQQLGLSSLAQNQQDAAKEVAYFFSFGAPTASTAGAPSMDLGYYFTAKTGQNFRTKLTELATYAESKGLKVARSSANGVDELTVTSPEAAAPTAAPTAPDAAAPDAAPPAAVPAASDTPFVGGLVVAANEDKLAIGSTEKLALRLFAPAYSGGFSTTSQYKDAATYLPQNRGDAVCATYFNFKQLVSTASTAAINSAPPDKRAELQSALNLMPLDYMVGYLTVEDNPVIRYALPFHAKSDQQQAFFTALQSAKPSAIVKDAPANSLFLISLDGALLKAIKDSTLSSMDPQQQAMMKPQLAQVDAINSLGIGVANASGASPFPEVYLVADSSDAAHTAEMLKTSTGALGASSGMPTTPWQKKDIEGVSVDYMLSPLGVGVFIGSTGNTVFLASSEGMAGAIISAGAGKVAGLSSVSPELSSKAAVTAYLHFGKLYELIDSVQGTLKMFAGGKSSFDTTQFAILQQLGMATMALTVDNAAVHMTANLKPTPKQP